MPMEPPPVGLDPLQNETHQPNRVCDKSTETPHRLHILNTKRLEGTAQLRSRTTKSTTNLRGSPSVSGPKVGPAQFDSATAKLVATLQIVRLCSVNSGSSVRVRSMS